MHGIRDHLSHFYVEYYSMTIYVPETHLEDRLSKVENDIIEIKKMIEQINQKLLRNGVI